MRGQALVLKAVGRPSSLDFYYFRGRRKLFRFNDGSDFGEKEKVLSFRKKLCPIQLQLTVYAAVLLQVVLRRLC